MFCMKCGAQLPEDAAFCTACGATVAGEQPQQQTEAQPVEAQQTQQTAPTEPVYDAYTQPVDTAERDKIVRSMLIWGGLSLASTLLFILDVVLGYFEVLVAVWSPDNGLKYLPDLFSESFSKPFNTLFPMAPVFGIVSSRIAKSKAIKYTSLYGEPTGKAKVGATLCRLGFVLGWVTLITLILMACFTLFGLGLFVWELSKWQYT